MFPSNPFQQYKEQALSTLTPGELLVKLYDELIKQMRIASLSMGKADLFATSAALTKSNTILGSLESSLDMQYEISANLQDLYLFIANHLIQAETKKNAEMIEECIPLIRDLRDAFEQADRESRKAHSSAIVGGQAI